MAQSVYVCTGQCAPCNRTESNCIALAWMATKLTDKIETTNFVYLSGNGFRSIEGIALFM